MERAAHWRWWGVCLVWAVFTLLLAFQLSSGASEVVSGTLCGVGFLLMLHLVRSHPSNLSVLATVSTVLVLAFFGRIVFLLLLPDSLTTAATASPPLIGTRIHRSLALIGDMALMGMLVPMMRLRKLKAERLLLYAANPLVLIATVGYASDFSFISPIVYSALYLLLVHHFASGYVALGVIFVKPYLAPAVWPFLLRCENRLAAMMSFLMLALFITLPLVLNCNALWLSIFAVQPATGGFISGPLQVVLLGWTAYAAWFVLAGCLAAVYVIEPDPLRCTFLAMGSVVVCLGAVDLDHLLLLAPFLCFFPSSALLCMQAGFIFWILPALGRPDHGGTAPVTWGHWSLWMLYWGLLIGLFVARRYLFDRHHFSSPKDVSVIIPTLNEADQLKRCIASVQNQSAVSEIIVADGGSEDATCQVAENCGARLIHSARGRGLQAATAVKGSQADVFLILHADCRLSGGVPAEIIRKLKERPGAPGGALGMRFESDRSRMRLVSFLNNCRARYTGISFGDQGQFVRREALSMTGGFPEIPIMEDVELAMRMKQSGFPLYLKRGITVSGRRWERTRFNANVRLVLCLFLTYLVERRWRPGAIDHSKYYRAYYSGLSRPLD